MADFAPAVGELDVVMDAVRILMSWRTVPSFRARVLYRLGNDTEREYELEAQPRELSYRLIDVTTGRVDQFIGETRQLISADSEMEYHPYMLTFEPLPVRLAFPMSLGIWGRSTDGYRIVGGTANSDNITLSLAHNKHPDLFGSLTVSGSRRMALRLDTPTEKCRYEGVEPL